MEISKNARVWIYQANRELKESEIAKIKDIITVFVKNWSAHEVALKANFEIRYQRFIVLMVDENQATASGCSIDKSVHLMKEIGEMFQVDFFDRMDIAYKQGDAVRSCSRKEFEQLISDGKITQESIVFNNLVTTVSQLESQWEVPFKESWHAKVF